MKNIFLISILILIISINSQPKTNPTKPQNKPNPNPNPKIMKPNPQQKVPEQKIQNQNDTNTKTNPNNNNNNTNTNIVNNTGILNDQKNNTAKKEFNLTESLIKFFNEMFGSSNTTNKTKTEEEKKKEEQKKIEEENKRKILEQLNIEKEKIEKKKRESKLKREKEREEFEKKIENISVSDFTNLNLEAKSGEMLYHNTTKPCKLTIVFILTDADKTIHFVFNGPNGKGGSSLIQSFRHKNFLYYTYDAKNVGQYTFYLNNYLSSEETEVVFAVDDDSKKSENKLKKQNIDKISGYLSEIDMKINTMHLKQNLVNRKTDKHNQSINRHNKKIMIYSIIEVVTMIAVFILQTCYIKRIVEKI